MARLGIHVPHHSPLRGDSRMGLIAALCMSAALHAAAPVATDRDGIVTLRNDHLEITFAAKGNMAPSSIRRTAEGSRNLMDLLIISYRTDESKWWYQDNKRGRFGYTRYTHRIEQHPGEARLIVEHPADGLDDPHFRFTKTVVLRGDTPFVELDYDFECVREAELKSEIAFPSLWYAPELSHCAFMGGKRTLFVGSPKEMKARGVVGRWSAGFDPKTGIGLLVVYVGEELPIVQTGWSRDLNVANARVQLRRRGGLRKGNRVHNRFALRPFKVADAAARRVLRKG